MANAAAPLSPAVVAEHGLSPDEFLRIREILGRDPNLVELGIYSALCSEHCSYKSSKPFPMVKQTARCRNWLLTDRPVVAQEKGERSMMRISVASTRGRVVLSAIVFTLLLYLIH